MCFCSFEPFTTRPVFGFYLPVFFFFLYGLFVDAVCSLFFFLSLSLRRWGNPNPLRVVWGSPCVLFVQYTLSDLDPYFLLDTYPKALPRTCFFFFVLSSSLVCRLGVFLVSCLGFGWFLGGGFWSVCVSVVCCGRSWLFAQHVCIRSRAMPVDPAAMAPHPLPLWIPPSRVTRLLLGVDPGTVGSTAVGGGGCHCDPANV